MKRSADINITLLFFFNSIPIEFKTLSNSNKLDNILNKVDELLNKLDDNDK